MNDKIRNLQKQIETEITKIGNCSHKFGKPFSNPDSKLVPCGTRTVGQGSDVWIEPTGYETVQIPRWTRICTLCGGEEHTNKQKPIVNGHEADFTQ